MILFSIWEIEFPDENCQAIAAVPARPPSPRQPTKPPRAARPSWPPNTASQEIVFAVRQPGTDGHWYANFGYYADRRRPPDLRQRRQALPAEPGDRQASRSCWTTREGGVRDPVVALRRQKILFSYRKGGTPVLSSLRDQRSTARGLRQLTDGPYDDIEPCYLPDGGIVFVSSRCKRWVNCWLTQVAVLHRCDADGGNIRPLSANIEHDNTPWLLPDGRILYSAGNTSTARQVDYHHLWTMNPDGTGQMVFFGNSTRAR